VTAAFYPQMQNEYQAQEILLQLLLADAALTAHTLCTVAIISPLLWWPS